MNNNEIKKRLIEDIINDLKTIKSDIYDLCTEIESSSLKTSTNNLYELVESISNALEEVFTKSS